MQIPLAIRPLIKAFYPQCLVPRIGLARKVIRFLVTHLPQTQLAMDTPATDTPATDTPATVTPSRLHLSRKSCTN